MERNLRIQAFRMSVADLGNSLKFALPFIGVFALHTYFNISSGMENAAATLWGIATSQQMIIFYWTPIFVLFTVVWYVLYYRAAVYSLQKRSGDLDTKGDGE